MQKRCTVAETMSTAAVHFQFGLQETRKQSVAFLGLTQHCPRVLGRALFTPVYADILHVEHLYAVRSPHSIEENK